MENQGFTCSNPRCARVFTNPMIVQDFSSKNKASYYGCPYCLVEIDIKKGPEVKEEKQKQKQKTKSDRVRQAIAQLKEVKPTQQPLEIDECPHHLGYLRQRSKDEEIPEECMTCEKLLECL